MKLLAIPFLSILAWAQPSLMTVTQQVTQADGTPFVGRIIIRAQSMESSSAPVRSAPIQYCSAPSTTPGCHALPAGLLTVRLVPNLLTQPYRVTYAPMGGIPYTESWCIPSMGGPFTIDSVIVSASIIVCSGVIGGSISWNNVTSTIWSTMNSATWATMTGQSGGGSTTYNWSGLNSTKWAALTSANWAALTN